MILPGLITLSAYIIDSVHYATLLTDGTVQVTRGFQAWTATPVNPADPSAGYTLSVNGRYLSTQMTTPSFKNPCLIVTTDPGQAARVVPVPGKDSFTLQLVGSGNVLTLDTRSYVTQFEPRVETNALPYFQHLIPPGWTLSVQNQTGQTVIAPAATTRFTQGQQAVVTVPGVGSLTLVDLGPVATGHSGIQVTSGAYRKVLTYPGAAVVGVQLSADKTFTVTAAGGGEPVTGPLAGPSPAVAHLPAGQTVYVTAFTNARYLQQVTITANGASPLRFRGSGEGNHMIANTSLETPADPSGWVNASVLIQFSPDGTVFHDSKISPVGTFSVYGYNQRTIVSEDATDDDFNDTAVILNWWVPLSKRSSGNHA